MNWKKVIKWWVIVGVFTVGIGEAWGWLEKQEVELTLGSFVREDEGEREMVAERRRMDFGQNCNFVVDEKMEIKALSLIEGERRSGGVGRLKADAEITQAARDHARDMVRKGYFSHIDWEGLDAGDRLSDLGIDYEVVGENLAFGESVEVAHRGLKKSESHMRNMVEERFARVGVGVLNGGKCGVVEVQNFAD